MKCNRKPMKTDGLGLRCVNCKIVDKTPLLVSLLKFNYMFFKLKIINAAPR